MFDHGLVEFGQGAIAARFHGHVYHYRAGLHLFHRVFVQQHGRRATGNQRSGDNDVGQFGALRYQHRLTLHPGSGHSARIAADTFGDLALFIGLERHVNKFCAQ